MWLLSLHLNGIQQTFNYIGRYNAQGKMCCSYWAPLTPSLKHMCIVYLTFCQAASQIELQPALLCMMLHVF